MYYFNVALNEPAVLVNFISTGAVVDSDESVIALPLSKSMKCCNAATFPKWFKPFLSPVPSNANLIVLSPSADTVQ